MRLLSRAVIIILLRFPKSVYVLSSHKTNSSTPKNQALKNRKGRTIALGQL